VLLGAWLAIEMTGARTAKEAKEPEVMIGPSPAPVSVPARAA